ncbi:hypothetical protein MY4038_003545 [Beauveria bassiana]
MPLTRSQARNGAAQDRTRTTYDRPKKRRLEGDGDAETPRQTRRRKRSPRITEQDHLVQHWLQEQRRQNQQQKESCTMRCILARGKSSASNRSQSRKRSELGDSDTGNAAVSYTDPKFNKLLEKHGSYLVRSPAGLTQQSQELCKELLARQPPLPSTDFFGDMFENICNRTQNRNEARVIQTITPHIVPSAEVYAMCCSSAYVIENWNESWSNAWLLSQIDKRPQPDYAVGFQQDAFTEEEREKMKPWIGDAFANDQSPFMATYMMYFPFLTCEVKCGSAALDAADRQNGLSMTIAVRGVVELFREVKRQEELHGEILGFSISHDASSVRLYAHYAEIDEKHTRCFREVLRTFYFTEQEGKERGTSYRIIISIYEMWVPMHLARIRSAVSQLPDIQSSCQESEDGSGYFSSLSELPPATAQTPVINEGPSKRPRIRGG